jgi:hypothetical protein
MAEPNVKEVTSELVVDTPTEKVSVEELLFLYQNVNESPDEGVNCLVIRYWV